MDVFEEKDLSSVSEEEVNLLLYFLKINSK